MDVGMNGVLCAQRRREHNSVKVIVKSKYFIISYNTYIYIGLSLNYIVALGAYK